VVERGLERGGPLGSLSPRSCSRNARQGKFASQGRPCKLNWGTNESSEYSPTLNLVSHTHYFFLLLQKASASSSDAGSSSSGNGDLKSTNQTDGSRRSSTEFLVGKRARTARGRLLENSVFSGIGDDDL